MTQYICDRCGKEVGSHYGMSNLKEISIPISKTKYNDLQTKRLELCEDCYREHEAIIDKLADIRLVLFKDFMPKSEDKG